MAITGQRLLDELGRKAWSGFNADDMVWDTDDSLQAKTELNGALRYLTALEDFPYELKNKSVLAIGGIGSYSAPIGQINKVYNTDTLKELSFIGDSSDYDKTLTGEPVGFWVDFNNPRESFRLYPIPDKSYNLTVEYQMFQPVKDSQNGSLKFEFENADDTLNLPANLELYFMDCLVLKTMEQNNKDQEDENYQPTINEFNERWQVFKKTANPVKVTPRVVW